jgi:signal peptidase I
LLVEYSKAFFPILLIVLVLRSFVAEPFKIPSGSMLPTLRVGDFILVNKFTYGLRLPVVNTKVVALGAPERGDVVVFKYPEDPRLDFIKRVIGLPGDRISYRNKQLFINDELVAVEPVASYVERSSRRGLGYMQEFAEQLPGAEHRILLDGDRGSADAEYRVPDGHYFVMGDNRDDSRDSRVWGYLPEKNLVGKAFFIWMHWDIGGDGLDFSRIGDRIR